MRRECKERIKHENLASPFPEVIWKCSLHRYQRPVWLLHCVGLLARENANRLYEIDKKDETYFYIFLLSPLQAVATGLYDSALTLSRTEHTLQEAVSLYSQPQNQLAINSLMFLTGELQKISDH